MRQEETQNFKNEYPLQEGVAVNRRFESFIDADLPSAANLAARILEDLDPKTHGVSWWTSLPTQERILIGDYLFQCTSGIELNLAEAKLHYLEWLGATQEENERIANGAWLDLQGGAHFKRPRSRAPIDDLPGRLERMHLCGFFRAIGSSLDCLGAAIIGVLGLSASLRYGDLRSSEKALHNLVPGEDAGTQIQVRFREFLLEAKRTVGANDWMRWTDQYRNMFVHRGRRASYHEIVPRDHLFYDARGQIIPRVTSKLHLARYPDRSEIEALVVGKNTLLNEEADETMRGVFQSCRQLEEETCKRLGSIWDERKNEPGLIEQPIDQWKAKIKSTNFLGYNLAREAFSFDELTINPSLAHRMLSAAVDDRQRSLWDGSEWAMGED